MISKYELNLVLDANFSSTEIKECISSCESIIGVDSIKQTDDIWLLKTAYPIRGQDQAYYVSYCVEIDWSRIADLNKDLSIVKWIAKFFLYNVSIDTQFITFAEMKSKYDESFPEEDLVGEEDSSSDNDVTEASMDTE